MSDRPSPRLETGAGMSGQSCGIQKVWADSVCLHTFLGEGATCDTMTPNMTQLQQRELTEDESKYMDSSRGPDVYSLYLILRTFHTPESTAQHRNVKGLRVGGPEKSPGLSTRA